MSETKWTPGPWKHALRNANEIMTTFHGVQIGRIYIDVTTDNEAEDAHLIAAAPELYTLLQRARYAAEDDYSCGKDLLDEIDAVLSKARGES